MGLCRDKMDVRFMSVSMSDIVLSKLVVVFTITIC